MLFDSFIIVTDNAVLRNHVAKALITLFICSALQNSALYRDEFSWVWEMFTMITGRSVVSWMTLTRTRICLYCRHYLSVCDILSNNGDNYTAVLALAFKSILLCIVFQEDALGWQGNYSRLLFLLLYLHTLLLYYFVKKPASVAANWHKRKK